MRDTLVRYEPGDQTEDWTKRSAFSPLDRVVATLRPTVTSDMPADARGAIGTRCEWIALWMIEPDDGRPLYTGMRTMHPVRRDLHCSDGCRSAIWTTVSW